MAGQSLVAAFGVFCLLANKSIGVAGQKGKSLRTQLESMYGLVTSKGLRIDEDLVGQIALHVFAAAAAIAEKVAAEKAAAAKAAADAA
jgi:hypothetical protein